MPSRYRDLQAAPPGWFLVYVSDTLPYFTLTPVACWAITDEDRLADTDTGVVALEVNQELHTLAEPIYSGLLGLYHESELTASLRGFLSRRGTTLAQHKGADLESGLDKVT
jgi:hypothetical protein